MPNPPHHAARVGTSGRRRAPLSAATALALVAAATVPVVLGGGGAAAETAGCTVDYQVSQWTGGFTVDVAVTDTGAALSAWTVGWSFGDGQQITSAWNAQVTQAGSTVTALNEAYNGAVASGGTIDFGFRGTWSGANATPTDFTLDGVACAGDTTGGTGTGTGTGTATGTATPTATGTGGTVTPTATATGTGTGGTSTPGSGCAVAGAVFCDGFEDQAGSVPSGRWSVYSRDCAGSGTTAVDASAAHSGSRSVEVEGVDGYCNHVFIRDTADMGQAGPVWDVRFWVMHTTPLPTGHVTFVAMNDANAGNTDLRFGGQDGALMWNRQSDDQTLPDQSPAGVAQSTALPVGTWNCVEFQVNGSSGAITTWINGVQVAGLSENGTPVSNVSDQWLAGSGASWRPSLTDLKLGWESYGGGGNDTLWFDDVALSTGRIGC